MHISEIGKYQKEIETTIKTFLLENKEWVDEALKFYGGYSKMEFSSIVEGTCRGYDGTFLMFEYYWTDGGIDDCWIPLEFFYNEEFRKFEYERVERNELNKKEKQSQAAEKEKKR